MNFTILNTSKSYFKYATWFVLLLSAFLRFAVWLQQRSIFLDEANLIRNYAEKSYAQLFGHLDYQQYAPPFFSVVMKSIFSLGGINELSARFFPLLCGIGLLFGFYKLGNRFLSPFSLLLAVLFLGFDKIFIDYATECKQYSSDAFIAVLLVLSTLKISYPHFKSKNALFLCITGSLAIWFSMSSVFVLAGIGGYFLYFFIKEKNYVALRKFVLVGLVWLAQFVVYFLLVLKSDAQSSNLQLFHNDFFFAFPPRSLADFNLLVSQLGGILNSIFGKTVIAAMLGTLGITVGVWRLWKENKAHFLLLVLPIVLTLVASTLHYYSIIARLTLFFLPMLLLITFIGFDFLFKKIPIWATVCLIALFIPTIALQQQLPAFVQPFRNSYPELRDGLDYIKKEQQPNEPIFIYYNASPVGYYYQSLHDKRYALDKLILQSYRCCDADIVQQDLTALHQKGEKRIWLLYDQPDYRFLLDFIEQNQGKILKKYDFYRGVAVLYEVPDFSPKEK
jgi:hypothetical protein